MAKASSIAKKHQTGKSNPKTRQMMAASNQSVFSEQEHTVEGSTGAVMRLAKENDTGVGAGVTVGTSWEDTTKYFKEREKLIEAAHYMGERCRMIEFANCIAAAETYLEVCYCVIYG